jgi:MoaA/NifB/PqqE/SkfB family radical SAM enzyme
MLGEKRLEVAIKKFVNQLAESRGIPYRNKDLEEINELFKEQGVTLNIFSNGSKIFINLKTKGKIVRERVYYWDTDYSGKTELIFDDLKY